MTDHATPAALKVKIGLGTAPGKVILCGEHAVVYGQPAIAAPVNLVQASVTVRPGVPGKGLVVVSHNLGGFSAADRQRIAERLAHVAANVAELLLSTPLAGESARQSADLLIEIDSSVPVERGLGSGAAIGVAMIRAFAAYFGLQLTTGQVSALAFETEKLHHGTPSGIDNTVVAYNRPVYFVRGQGVALLKVGAPLHLLIADSGSRGSTATVVGDLRQRHEAAPTHYDPLLRQIGDIARQCRAALEAGDVSAVGRLFDHNHALLQELDLSNGNLDRLVAAARQAGALGAKLSGAGRGGNMIALVQPEQATAVHDALVAAGAVVVIGTVVEATS